MSGLWVAGGSRVNRLVFLQFCVRGACYSLTLDTDEAKRILQDMAAAICEASADTINPLTCTEIASSLRRELEERIEEVNMQ